MTGTVRIQISWSAAAAGSLPVAEYRLMRNLNSGGFQLRQILYPTNPLVFLDDVDVADTAVYRVVTVDSGGNLSSNSNTYTKVTTLTNPGVVVLSGNVVDRTTSISWTAASAGTFQLASYRVMRSLNGGAYTLVSTVAAAAPRVFGETLDFNTTVAYRIVAVDSWGNLSADSNTLTLMTTVTSPEPVTLTISGSGADVELDWTAAVYTEGTVVGYSIRRSDNGGPFVEVDTVDGSTLHFEESVDPDSEQAYVVVAVPDVGAESDDSNTVSRELSPMLLGVNNTSTPDVMLRSSDGLSWTAPAISGTGTNLAMTSVARAPASGVLVATQANQISRSTDDGATWTAVAVTGQWQDVAWSPTLGLFAIVGVNAGAGVISTSPDGTTWTSRTVPATTGYFGVIWDSRTGYFYAVSTGGARNVTRSSDGVTWALVTTAAMNGSAGSFANSGSLLLIADANDFGAYTSTDGDSWTLNLYGVGSAAASGHTKTFGNSLFVVGNVLKEYRRSATGTSGWALAASPPAGTRPVGCLAWSSSLNLFISICSSGATADQQMVATSADASTWTLRSTPVAADSKNWSRIIQFNIVNFVN